MKKIIFLTLMSLYFGSSGLLWAGGPILVDTAGSGAAVTWQGAVVRFNPESGDLGRLSNAAAIQMVRDLLDVWKNVTINGVATVNFTVAEGANLGNVDETNVDRFFSYCPPGSSCPSERSPFVIGSARSGQSPILFDSNGTITDLIQGKGSNDTILGFAGPRVAEVVDGKMVITEGQAILNGLFIDCSEGAGKTDPCQSPEVSLDEFKGVIFHELGHFIGLDHTQVNLASAVKALHGDKSEIEAVPTMFPIFIDGVAQGTPHYDDKVAVSFLYPNSDYHSQFCTLSGTVYQSDGTTELQGVNVVAARVDNPLSEATSFVSGALYTGKQGSCDNQVGGYQLTGLIPGVDYQLSIEKISSTFTGGSSIEPCDPPLSGFKANTVAGTFACTQGGEVIQTGSATSTKVVTTKTATTTDSTGGGNASSGGCSLIP